MARTVLKATQDQFQWVMFFLSNFVMPEKVGTRSYNVTERGRIQERISALFDDLLPSAYYAGQHGVEFAPLFGDKDDWIADPDKPGEKKCIKPSKEYTIEFSQKGLSGMIWLFSVLLTPIEIRRATNPLEKDMSSHPYAVSPALASRFVWPLVRQIGKEVELRRAVGLDDQEFEPWTVPTPMAPDGKGGAL